MDVAKKATRHEIKDISAGTMCGSVTRWTVKVPVKQIRRRGHKGLSVCTLALGHLDRILVQREGEPKMD